MGAKEPFILPIEEVEDLAEGAEIWRAIGARSGGMILRGVSGDITHRRLLSLAEQIGTPMRPVIGVEHIQVGLVYDIRPLSDGIVDKRGRVVRSTTFQSIPLHTDGYNAPQPPRLVLLQVVVPGTGGLTTVSRVGDVADLLRPRAAELLSQPVYPVASGVTSILNRRNDEWTMRYNGYEIRAFLEEGENTKRIENAHVGALSELSEVLEFQEAHSSGRALLLRGDVLVLDNLTTLNGRLALTRDDSEQLIHRVWCS